MLSTGWTVASYRRAGYCALEYIGSTYIGYRLRIDYETVYRAMKRIGEGFMSCVRVRGRRLVLWWVAPRFLPSQFGDTQRANGCGIRRLFHVRSIPASSVLVSEPGLAPAVRAADDQDEQLKAHEAEGEASGDAPAVSRKENGAHRGA
jgi:hypothetical protein